MISQTHETAVTSLRDAGWHTEGFRDSVRRQVFSPPWNAFGEGADVMKALSCFYIIPDAWRFMVEDHSHGWNHPVLVLEMGEVTVGSALMERKLDTYTNLWSALDATDAFSLRVVEFDKYGILRSTLDDAFFIPRYHRMIEDPAHRASDEEPVA